MINFVTVPKVAFLCPNLAISAQNELMMSLCHLKIVNFLKIYSITLGNEG